MKNNVSSRTKQCKKLAIIFRVASLLCWLGVAAFALIATMSKVSGTDKAGYDLLSEAVKTKLVSLSITVLIGLILSLLIKEKARLTVYMLSLLIITFLYGEVSMYIVLAIWAVDEYIFFSLYKRYKSLILINKEIDRRE